MTALTIPDAWYARPSNTMPRGLEAGLFLAAWIGWRGIKGVGLGGAAAMLFSLPLAPLLFWGGFAGLAWASLRFAGWLLHA